MDCRYVPFITPCKLLCWVVLCCHSACRWSETLDVQTSYVHLLSHHRFHLLIFMIILILSNNLKIESVPKSCSPSPRYSFPLSTFFHTFLLLRINFCLFTFHVLHQGETKTVCDASWPAYSPYNKLVRKVRDWWITIFSRFATNGFLFTLWIFLSCLNFILLGGDVKYWRNDFSTFLLLSGIYFLSRIFEKHPSGVFENKIAPGR